MSDSESMHAVELSNNDNKLLQSSNGSSKRAGASNPTVAKKSKTAAPKGKQAKTTPEPGPLPKHEDEDLSEDDMFEPTVIAKNLTAASGPAAGATKAEQNVQVPEGRILACPPGVKNVVTGTVLGASVKIKNAAPTSVKVNILITNIKNGGKDVIVTGNLTSFMSAETDKVKTERGAQIHAKLIATDVEPTVKITGGTVQCTLTNLKGGKGEVQAIVQQCAPGATIQLIGMHNSKWGMSIAYVACDEFKITTKANAEAPRENVERVINEVRKSGDTLLTTAGFHCTSFREATPPSDEVAADFRAVTNILVKEKAAFQTAVSSLNPHFKAPEQPLLLVDSSSPQLAPVLLFHYTKVEDVKRPGKGVLLNDAQIAALFSSRKYKNPEALNKSFNGGPVVATVFHGSARVNENAGKFAVLCEIHTQVSFVTNYATSAPAKFAHILTVEGPTVKVPISIMAAPFGVNERTTADLLLDSVLPFANMLVMPNKCKVFEQKYEDPNYKQDFMVDAGCQLTVDVRTTLRNVGLRLSAKTVATLYDGAQTSTPVVASGGALTDLLADMEDCKPTVSTLTNHGGVVSLCETAVTFDDPTLEFYGVVIDMGAIAQGVDNFNCGTDASVGDALFKEALGGSKLTEAMKKGEAAVFAVRIAPKTVSVASSSTAA